MANRYTLTNEQRQQQVQDLTQQLEEGVKSVFESEKYAQYLKVMSHFTHYSVNNTILIAMQTGGQASMVAGYTAWQKNFGRQVNRGEKAIKIFAPMTYKRKKEVDMIDQETGQPLRNPDGSVRKEIIEVTVPSFRVTNVFDISQTSGPPLPTLVDELEGKKFYRLLFTLLYGKAKFYKLELNHRQTDSLISMTTGLREAILREKMSEMKAEVKNLQSRMKHAAGSSIAGSVSEEYLSKIAGDGDICLLCRNNGQVLRLSAILRKRGVNHIVNAYEHNRCFGAWVGSVFSNFNKAMINEEEFEDLYNDCGILSPYSAQEVWDRAAGMLGKPDNFRLGTNELLRAVYMSQLDDPVFHNQHQSNIIVSNIHKAKGREYNAVIVEERFIDGLVRRKKDIGEYKTLYVAVTRPKTQLYSANMVSGDGVRIWNIWKTGRKRWIKLVNGVLKFLEVRGNTDIDVNSFNMFGNDVQEYIAHNVQTGDEIILRKSKANEIFRYDIVHIKDEIETVIGRCTHLLDDDIEALLDTDDSFQWPAEVRELYVTDVYTHIGDQITETESALGKGNVWNWVDFCGLGRLVYDVY